MNKLGSSFIKPLGDYERPVVGSFTFRQLVLIFGIGLGVLLSTVVLLVGLPDIFMYLVLVVTTPPFMVYGLKLDDKIKDWMRFNFTTQTRVYLTEFDDKGGSKAYGFIQAKNLSEADSF